MADCLESEEVVFARNSFNSDTRDDSTALPVTVLVIAFLHRFKAKPLSANPLTISWIADSR